MSKKILLSLLLIASQSFSQEVYELDTKYPVHDLDTHLQVFADTLHSYTPETILGDTTLPFQNSAALPKRLLPNVTYWAKIRIQTSAVLEGWKLHFQDTRIGLPAWAKSNGKVDVYAYDGERLIFHGRTGVDYPKKTRSTTDHWVLNSIGLEAIPANGPITLIIRAKGNSFGHPPYFNLSARSPSQPYYHQIYQFHNSFNIFMFGVTFIVFLYHLLQFLYLRDRLYFWCSLWLFSVLATHTMTVGVGIGNVPIFRFSLWLILANSVLFTFWFFGRAFIESKRKFPVLDKFILGFALLIIAEIAITVGYVLVSNPERDYTGPGFHFVFLNAFAVASLMISLLLTFKKDLFARYFGIGSTIGSLFFIVGTLWSFGMLKSMPFNIDPYATGIFLQIIIYSFGIAFRRQKINEKNEEERLLAERSMAEIGRMKDLDEIKTRFFANISHEFRTPLALISGPIQSALKRSANEQTIPLARNHFKIISKNTKRLENLVDQLLELSKIESGKVHLSLKQGGLIQFIRSIVFSFESMAERKNISLNSSFPQELEHAFFDKDKLEKIITNLLSNAFKYTPENGAVTVTIDGSESHLLLEVTDTGKGIAKEELKRIFERFYRVEGNEKQGSGIGLALTKELVEVHNGTISVDSTKDKGTTFKIRLPIVLAHLPQGIAVFPESNSAVEEDTRRTIEKPQPQEAIEIIENKLPVALLIEDNADLRQYIREVILQHFQVKIAKNGLQGERMAIEHIPDIILSDVMMPKKDGYALCNALKANPKTCHIPVILLTAKAGQENKIAGLTQGADAYLTKPFDEDELLLLMRNLVESRKNLWDYFKALDMLLVDEIAVTSIDDTFLQQVFKIIKENLDNGQFGVDDMARHVGFSRSQLHRKLKAISNKSANQLITEVRLNEAHHMLKHKKGTVSEIAYSVGYSNLSYFTKSFKEKFGFLPSKA
ncbi:MAG: ATP-binding protein [Bacteroidota bacterium]